MNWNDANIARLKQLCDEKRSYEEIGKLLGCSVGSVAGKTSRLGINNGMPKGPRRNEFGEATKPRPPRIRTKRATVKETVLLANLFDRTEAMEFFKAPNPIGLLALNSNTCRWPYGDPKTDEFHFCGGKPSVGKPYCPTHCRMGYRPATERKAA